MSRIWSYLTDEDSKLFREKAKTLGMTEYELNQRLITMFLHTPADSKPNLCINCQYYLIATSTVIQALMKVNEAFSLVTPEYIRKKSKQTF